MIRHLAWEILRSGSSTPTRLVTPIADREGLEPRDRGLLRRIVGTDVRRRATLNAMLRELARGKPNRDLAAILRVGLVQIFFLDQIPDHAAVSETMRASMDVLGPAKARYVNAVLREAIRRRRTGHSGDPKRDLIGRDLHFADDLFRDPDEHPYLWAEDALSMPSALVKRWDKRHGRERAFALCIDALEEPPLSIRCVGVPSETVASELVIHEVSTHRGKHDAILLASSADTHAVVTSDAFTSGRITVQGETALRAAELAQAAPGERWLDLCAAPGGKTAVLAAAGASVLACDIDASKLERVQQTAQRLGVMDHIELRLLEDGAPPAEQAFDGVLVDAPCSNTGVLAARPDARWRFGPAQRHELAELQTQLIETGAERVRPGGVLIWSTCSLEPEENGQLIRAFLERHDDFELVADHEFLPEISSPAGPIDGGCAARLVRRG
jgi:16S rRNA (cytosine967-C5)-methyltransferase